MARREERPAEEPQPPAGGTPPSLVPEFEDEPPGAYLRELRVRNWNVVWSALNLLLALAIVCGWHIGGPLTPQSSWWAAAGLIWTLLPPSCVILLLVTSWQAILGSRDQSRGRVRAVLFLSGIALGVWIGSRWWAGVDFAVPE